MLNIVIIGTGNVSHHLCRAIENSKALNLLQLFGRIEKLPQNFNQKIVYTNNLEELKKISNLSNKGWDKGIKGLVTHKFAKVSKQESVLFVEIL